MTKQSRQPEKSDPRTNRILATLEQADYDALMLEADVVPLKFRKRLHLQDERVDAVYFPITCMVSLVVTNDARRRWRWLRLAKRELSEHRRSFKRSKLWA